jgi:hypothetical protein
LEEAVHRPGYLFRAQGAVTLAIGANRLERACCNTGEQDQEYRHRCAY